MIHSSELSGLVSQLLLKGYQVRLAYCLGVLVLQVIEESSQMTIIILSNLLAADKRMASLTPSSLESQFDQPSVTIKRRGCHLRQASYCIKREGICSIKTW